MRKSGNGGRRSVGDGREKPWIRENEHRNNIQILGLLFLGFRKKKNTETILRD